MPWTVYGWYPLKLEHGGIDSGAMGIFLCIIKSCVLLLLWEPGRFPEGFLSFRSLGSFSNLLGRILGLGFSPLRRAISSLSLWISSSRTLIVTDCCSVIPSNWEISRVFSSSGILGICIFGTFMHCVHSTSNPVCLLFFLFFTELFEKLLFYYLTIWFY